MQIVPVACTHYTLQTSDGGFSVRCDVCGTEWHTPVNTGPLPRQMLLARPGLPVVYVKVVKPVGECV